MAIGKDEKILTEYYPQDEGRIDGVIFDHPHSNPLILHPPEQCKRCDRFPLRQCERFRCRVNFTGEYDTDRLICPSERAR